MDTIGNDSVIMTALDPVTCGNITNVPASCRMVDDGGAAMNRSRITDDMFARIPALLLGGRTKDEIAAMYGVTLGTLVVRCSQRGISLRKGGSRPNRNRLPKRTNLTLPLSDGVLKSLRDATRAMGKDSTAQLVSDLLEKIAGDGLYKAVLDEDVA
jgi:hypothetical protein